LHVIGVGNQLGDAFASRLDTERVASFRDGSRKQALLFKWQVRGIGRVFDTHNAFSGFPRGIRFSQQC
jgi:hypothetical protein